MDDSAQLSTTSPEDTLKPESPDDWTSRPLRAWATIAGVLVLPVVLGLAWWMGLAAIQGKPLSSPSVPSVIESVEFFLGRVYALGREPVPVTFVAYPVAAAVLFVRKRYYRAAIVLLVPLGLSLSVLPFLG